jgi:ribonuclease D
MDTKPAKTRHTFLERPSREAIDAMPAFTGLPQVAVCLVETAEQAALAGQALSQAHVLGFDTESKPNFLPDQPKTGPHLIQIATPEQAFLFRAEGGAGLEVLREVLESTRVLKVGFGLSNDRGPLSAKLRIRLRHTLDLCPVVRRLGYRQKVGLQAAVAIVLGQRLPKSKSVQTSNWAAKVLTPAQRVYAANDAYAGLKVYEQLLRDHPGLVGELCS